MVAGRFEDRFGRGIVGRSLDSPGLHSLDAGGIADVDCSRRPRRSVAAVAALDIATADNGCCEGLGWCIRHRMPGAGGLGDTADRLDRWIHSMTERSREVARFRKIGSDSFVEAVDCSRGTQETRIGRIEAAGCNSPGWRRGRTHTHFRPPGFGADIGS